MTITRYIIVSRLNGGDWKPVYVYEFTAQEAVDYNQSTQYESKETAIQAKELLVQLAQINGVNAEYGVREYTVTIKEVE